MKKIFGISLIAVLAISPIMANAAVTDADPGATVTSGASVAADTPKYALKPTGENDGDVATAAYVKGAYNAVIKGVNKTQEEVNTLNTNIGTYQNAIDHLLDGKATKAGTVATVKSATTTESIATSSVNITGVTTSSISATASGNVNLSVPIKNDWESDTVAANPVQVTTSFSGLDVDDLAMSAPTNNTATLTKTGITGSVNVAQYIAQPPYNYTPLISDAGSSYTGRSVIYPEGTNNGDVSGLSNGEWTVTWNSYGTAKGTSICSRDWQNGEDQYDNGSTISGTPASVTDEDAPAGCWCKLTSFTENNNGPTHNDTSLWVFNVMYSSASDCASNCAYYCGDNVRYLSAMRSGLFGSVGQ